MSSKPPDVQPGRIPDEFDLDVRFGERTIPGRGFVLITRAGCTQFGCTEGGCPGTELCPVTDHACFGGTGIDTVKGGATCQRLCGETRVGTCVAKACIITLHKACLQPVATRHLSATCVNTCFSTCAGCNPPATNSAACG